MAEHPKSPFGADEGGTSADAITDVELMELQSKGASKAFTGKLEAPNKQAAQIENIPDWAQIPGDLTIPRGKVVAFMKFEAKNTERPWLGDRIVLIWTLSVRDERLARQRAQGEASRIYEELAKATIRAADGKRLDNDPGALDELWDAIGPKYRTVVMSWYHAQHGLSDEDRMRFFASCVATRTAG